MLVNKFEDWGEDYKSTKKVSKSNLISILTDNMILVENVKLIDNKINIDIYLNDDTDLKSLEEYFKNKFDIVDFSNNHIEIGYNNKNIELI